MGGGTAQEKTWATLLGLHMKAAIVVSNNSEPNIWTVRTDRFMANVSIPQEAIEVEAEHADWPHRITGCRTPTQFHIQRAL